MQIMFHGSLVRSYIGNATLDKLQWKVRMTLCIEMTLCMPGSPGCVTRPLHAKRLMSKRC